MFALTDEEWSEFRHVPMEDVLALVTEYGLVALEGDTRREMLSEVVVAIVARARRVGLPFSKYDADDLGSLTVERRSAIAKLQGLRPDASVRAIVAAGERVARQRGADPTRLHVPMLLAAIARAAAAS